MGTRPCETQNQRRGGALVQRQRILHHRLSQRRLQGSGQKRFPAGQIIRQRREIRCQTGKQARQAGAGQSLTMFLRVHCLRDFGCVAVLSGIFCCNMQAGFSLPITGSARSVSGQFIVISAFQSSALFTAPGIVTDTNFVRLEPALLAISAERVRETLWRELGVNGPWRGKVFLVLRPAQSPNDDVIIVSKRLADGWDYHVSLPDVLSHTHFARAMVSVVLLEFANRNASMRSAEIPGWLTDGLSQQLLAADWREMILSSPSRVVNGLLAS